VNRAAGTTFSAARFCIRLRHYFGQEYYPNGRWGLPYPLETVLAKIPCPKPHAEFKIGPLQFGAFAVLIIDHVHFVGPPKPVQILSIVIQRKGFQQRRFSIIVVDLE
jgi:hypothetical protein